MALLCALLACAGGCLRLFDGGPNPPGDVTARDAAPADQPPAQDVGRPADQRVDHLPDADTPFGSGAWQLGPVEQLAGVNSADSFEASPWLSPDGQTLIFAAGTGQSNVSDWNLFHAARQGPTQFAAPLPLAGLNSPSSGELHLSQSFDGLHAVLTANWESADGKTDLWVGRRGTAATEWTRQHFVKAATTSQPGYEHDALISWDGLGVTFTAFVTTNGTPNTDLFMAWRATTADDFGARQPLTELNTASGEDSPALSPDGQVIVFTSNRGGGAGSDDLWWARRTPDGSFGAAQPVPGVNTAAKEREAFISHDGTELLFASNRPVGGASQWDLYRVAILAGP